MPRKNKPLGYRGPRANSPTTSKMLKVARRRKQAAELKIAGYSLRAIASKLGVARTTVHKDIMCWLSDDLPPEKKQQQRAIEQARLDNLWAVFYPKALTGDTSAGRLCVTLSHERSQLSKLHESGGDQHVHLHAGPDAQSAGIQVNLVASNCVERDDGSVWRDGQCVQGPRPTDDPPRQIEHRPQELQPWPPFPKQSATPEAKPISNVVRMPEGTTSQRNDIWERPKPLSWLK